MGDKTGAFADHLASTTNAGSIHRRHNSWGRTRRPKDLWDGNAIASKQAATTVTVIGVGNLNDDLDDATAGHNGYSTENQQYLHLHLTGDDDAAYTVHLYGYNYAFGAWGKLYIPVKGTTADNTWKAANFNTIDDSAGGPKHVIVDIAGVDRIALVAAGGHIAKITARMACSTF